eukprot:4682348-Heterocapsa_arctica.AAC.1
MQQRQQQMRLIADGRMLNPARRPMVVQGHLPPTPPAVPNSYQQGGAMEQAPQWGALGSNYWNQY